MFAGIGARTQDASEKPFVMPGLDPGIQAEMPYYTYILASRRNGTLYVGVTNDLVRRVYEHRSGAVEGFTKRYAVKMLVYFEVLEMAAAAVQREKNIKKWPRQWKLDLLENSNPTWRNLYDEICT
jgi:putative endonuclease